MKNEELGIETVWRKGDALLGWMGNVRPSIFINDGIDLLICREEGGRLVLKVAATSLLPSATIRIIGLGGTNRHTKGSTGLLTCAHDTENTGQKTCATLDIVGMVRQTMGLDGAPAYPLTVTRGTVRSQRLFLELDAKDGGVDFAIPKTPLPTPLHVIVHGLADNAQVFLVDKATRKWRPLGVLEGTAYAVLDTNKQEWDVFIGHPLTTVVSGQGSGARAAASHSDLRVNLVPVGENAWRLELHNPTHAPITATVTPSPSFTLLDWPGETLTVPAGQSIVRELMPALR